MVLNGVGHYRVVLECRNGIAGQDVLVHIGGIFENSGREAIFILDGFGEGCAFRSGFDGYVLSFQIFVA
ncbi:hypothetical protein SDC9_99251 [bioreactor metagenome]|uniref:Uncharacterized protein n=1 Tax=bioreactor metagenome TaxID=1076179 RepID=A0A645AH04_9ZZZZ